MKYVCIVKDNKLEIYIVPEFINNNKVNTIVYINKLYKQSYKISESIIVVEGFNFNN